MPFKIFTYMISFLFMASGFAIGADSVLNLKAAKTISLKKTDAADVISVAALAQGSIVLSDWDLTKSPPDHRMELYGSDGKLIRRIGEMGKGPGNYSILRSLIVDENNVIWAADSGQHRLSRYGIDGGLIGSDLIMNPSFSPSSILLKPESGKKYLAGCLPKDGTMLKGCLGLVHEYDMKTNKFLRSFLSTVEDQKWLERSYRRLQETFMDSESSTTLYVSSMVASGFWILDLGSGKSRFVTIPTLPELPDMAEVAEARKAWDTLQTISHIFQIKGDIYVGVRTPANGSATTQILKFDSSGKFLAKTASSPGILAGKTKNGKLIFTKKTASGVSVLEMEPIVNRSGKR